MKKEFTYVLISKPDNLRELLDAVLDYIQLDSNAGKTNTKLQNEVWNKFRLITTIRNCKTK